MDGIAALEVMLVENDLEEHSEAHTKLWLRPQLYMGIFFGFEYHGTLNFQNIALQSYQIHWHLAGLLL